VERAPPPAAFDLAVALAVACVGRTLLSDAFDLDFDLDLDLDLDLDCDPAFIFVLDPAPNPGLNSDSTAISIPTQSLVVCVGRTLPSVAFDFDLAVAPQKHERRRPKGPRRLF
jgi:hypothetical protein